MDHNLRLWVGTPRGIAELKGNHFINYPLSDSSTLKYTYSLLETKTGNIWASTSAGVYEYRNSKWWKLKLYSPYTDHACRNNVHVGEIIIDSEVKIPPLILQPFVENALWHGLNKKEGDKEITLNIAQESGWLVCEITDNGIGRKRAKELYETFPEGHLSKAVSIIRHRLVDFNQVPDTDPITIIDLEENGKATGTTVIVRIKA